LDLEYIRARITSPGHFQQLSRDLVLLLGCRHSVEPRTLNTQTHEKVCVWCVYGLNLHSVGVR
jgi:hypothetical protein